MNFKKVIFPTLCLSMVISTQARIPNRGSSTSVPTRTGVADRADTPSVGKPGTIMLEDSASNCRANNTGGYVSQSFLRNITDPNVPDSDVLRIQESTPGVYEVKMDKYFSACTDLKFEVRKVDNNFFVRVKNHYEFTPENIHLNEGEDIGLLSDDEKYYRCLEGKDMLANGGFDWAKAEQRSEIVYGTTSSPFTVDVGEGKESVSLYYASPEATEYPKDFPAGNVSPHPSDWRCTVYENFNQNREKRLYTSYRDQVYDRAMQACQTESAEKILEELSKLRESSAGNFRALERILEQAFDKAQERRVDEIYARMDAIEEELKDEEDLDRSDIKELGGEYADLALELNKIVVQPSVERIEALLERREDASDNEQAEIDIQIKELNDKISRFANENPNPSKGDIDKIYDRLEEQGLVDEARNIEGLRLASHFYGRLYHRRGGLDEDDNRGRPLTMKRAENEIRSKLREFESKELQSWEEAYAVKNGEDEPLRNAARDVQLRYRRMQQDYQTFQQNEYKYTMQYCGTSIIGTQRNPYQCNRWMSGQQQRQQQFQSIIGNHTQFINQRSANYQNYLGLYQNYMQNNQSREPSSSGSGFSFYGSGDPMSSQNYSFMGVTPMGTNNMYNMTGNNSFMANPLMFQ
ncbi:MAG: hypothetical protein CME63_18080 [Halobacteriovoraceae bacterium]|nr:hypothetical protein [Halobacteriovoraceae bacterium]|tara:strand:- start:3405 stop:5315 length:1911 start_codon:yes stop_codon:yes gene_type:complete